MIVNVVLVDHRWYTWKFWNL